MGVWRRKRKNEDKEEAKKLEETKKVKEVAPLFFPEEPKYSFDDIILSQGIKEQILDVAEYANNRKKVFEDWGLQTVYKNEKQIGINFYGAPGTGKTMAAHAFAKYLGRKILIVSYADLESKYVGETPKNIRKAFETAKETDSILFFDEADAILSKRVTDMSSAHDVSVNQTRSVMLMLMNEYQDFVIFATNFIENFDPAFIRRISSHIKFTLPDLECREKLWRHYIVSTLPNNIDIDELAKKYEDISGSDISNAVLKAAFKAARKNLDFVDKELIYEMIENIIAGKRANKKADYNVNERKIVSEDYVREQIATQTVIDGEGGILK